MILRFHPEATPEQRAAVAAALAAMECEAAESGAILVLGRLLRKEEAERVGALEGVAAVLQADPRTITLREDFLRRTAAVALVIGLLFLVASNLPPGLGAPADPLVTPTGLKPAWPMLAWQAMEERAPRGTPVGLLILAAGLALFAWPFLGRRLAERRPALHAALGLLALAAGLGLTILGLR